MNHKPQEDKIKISNMSSDNYINSLVQIIDREDISNISDENLRIKRKVGGSSTSNETVDDIKILENNIIVQHKKNVDDQKRVESSDFYRKLSKRESDSFTNPSIHSSKSTIEPYWSKSSKMSLTGATGIMTNATENHTEQSIKHKSDIFTSPSILNSKLTIEPHWIKDCKLSLPGAKAVLNYATEKKSDQVREQQTSIFTCPGFYNGRSAAESESKNKNEVSTSNKSFDKIASENISDQSSRELSCMLSHCTLYNRKVINNTKNEKDKNPKSKNNSLLFQPKEHNEKITDFFSFNKKHNVRLNSNVSMPKIETVSRIRSRLEKAGVYNRKIVDAIQDDVLISYYSNLPIGVLSYLL